MRFLLFSALASVLFVSLVAGSVDISGFPDVSYDACQGTDHARSRGRTLTNKIKETNEAFYDGADYGVLKKHIRELEHGSVFGTADSESSLHCIEDAGLCEGRHVAFTLPAVTKTEGQRWAAERDMIQEWTTETTCDVTLAHGIFLKPDSHANFYHMMCDMINLYVSQRATTQHAHTAAGGSVDLFIYTDKTWRSNFNDIYRAYTGTLGNVFGAAEYGGKTMCFESLVLAVNPRGARPNFFFNMYVPGRLKPQWGEHLRQNIKNQLQSGYNYDVVCDGGSQFFREFLTHIYKGNPLLFRGKSFKKDGERALKVRLLSRSSGKGRTSGTRKLKNEQELVTALRQKYSSAVVDIEIVDFDWTQRVPAMDQINTILKTDVLVAMHGAGLAHLLWLPTWGSVVEVFNCEDHYCYSDLAHLSGVDYFRGDRDFMTQFLPEVEVREKSKENQKFYDYSIDIEHGIELLEAAIHSAIVDEDSPFEFTSLQTHPRYVPPAENKKEL